MSRYQKGKTNLDFTEARDNGGSGISWAICKSAPRSRQITTPTLHHSIFTGQIPFLPPNQQWQSTEGRSMCPWMTRLHIDRCLCSADLCRSVSHSTLVGGASVRCRALPPGKPARTDVPPASALGISGLPRFLQTKFV